MLIAVMDDADPLFAQVMANVIRRRGHAASHAASVEEISDLFQMEPSAIVYGAGTVDDELIEGIRRLRAAQPSALVLLAAEEIGPRWVVKALEAGANNILQKPLLPEELIARLEHLPLPQTAVARGAIRVLDLEVDLDEIRAVKAGQPLTLTRMEFRLLYCLAEYFGRVAPTERLMSFSGGEVEEVAASGLKTHISHIRRKLREKGGVPMRITSRQMLGYVLEAPREGEGEDES